MYSPCWSQWLFNTYFIVSVFISIVGVWHLIFYTSIYEIIGHVSLLLKTYCVFFLKNDLVIKLKTTTQKKKKTKQAIKKIQKNYKKQEREKSTKKHIQQQQ